MCGYDPFWIYDWQLDTAYEMDKLGFDNYSDYMEYLDNLGTDVQIQDLIYESIKEIY